MSDNATGTFGGTDGGLYNADRKNHTSGPFTATYVRDFDGAGSYPNLYKITMNIAHTHSLPASYIYGNTDASGNASETRPVNYTMRIWKRIS